jgi:hypothetical protein
MTDTVSESNNVFTAKSGGALELVTRAACDGATDARAAANQVWVATGRFVSRFVYTTCYTVSYGVVFPTTLLCQAIPKNNAVVRGLIDGAKAATEKLDELQHRAQVTTSSEPLIIVPA